MLLVSCVSGCASAAAPSGPATAIPVLDSQLHGTLETFSVDGHLACVVTPSPNRLGQRASEWVWFMPATFFSGGPWKSDADYVRYANAFLDAGLIIASVDVGLSCGSPASMRIFENFYLQMARTYRVGGPARLFAQSRGGLDAYAFAELHPDQVDRIGGIYPAVDWRNWPGINALPRAPLDVAFSADDVRNENALNPINNLRTLAQRGIRLFHVHGDIDDTVSLEINSRSLVAQYRAMGGDADLIVINGYGHYTYGFYRSEMVAFLVAN